MIFTSRSRLLPILLSFLSILYPVISETCKCTPKSSCWPTVSDWSSFNKTISGALLAGIPPARVCYPGPAYNSTSCTSVSAGWFDSNFHAANPISIDYPYWANNSCDPIYPNGTSITGDTNAGAKGCTIGAYPVYVVNATSADQVSKTLKWAAEKNIRVVIKNTGHNVPGRSTGYGSLSIWTHNIRGITYHSDFQPADCALNGTEGKQMAATIAAGERDINVYSEMAKYDAVVVGGSNPSVGIMGWFQGGGHGPLSSSYGMGADNLLQATVVTPAGDIVTANACQHSELFFALRGGGGGTWGVLIDVVMKAYPSPQTTVLSLNAVLIEPNATSQWWDLIAYIHAEMPYLKAAGAQGYYAMLGPPLVQNLTLIWGTYHYNKPNGSVEALYAPVKDRLDGMKGLVTYNISIDSSPTFLEIYNSSLAPEPVAQGGMVMGSWLLTEKAVTQDVERVARTFETIGPKIGPDVDLVSNPVLLGHFVANSANRGLDIGMNPAWRDAVTHFMVAKDYIDGSPKAVVDAAWDDILYNKTYALKQLAPDSGAYFNEANPFEPEWQWVFFGKNYERLRKVKREYDPHGLLWCRSCVGSEEWVEQEDGTLCRPA